MGWFDKFASAASTWASRAPFFAACVLLVIVWFPTLFFMKIDTSQLIINTATTIITFLLVALLQNSQERFEKATNAKLNAIADFLADFASVDASDELNHHIKDLRQAVGLEENIGA